MNLIVRAYGRALGSLRHGWVWWHLLWPMLIAALLWGAAALFFWHDVSNLIGAWIGHWLDLLDRWLGADMRDMAARVAGGVLAALMFLPLLFVAVSVATAVFGIPAVLERLAAADYPGLARARAGSQWVSAGIALAVGAVYLVALLCLLPLWFVPGLWPLLPLLLTAELNRRTYGYDVLIDHASAAERRTLLAEHRSRLFGVGLIGALLALIPPIALFAPLLTGLAYLHYCLSALGAQRAAHQGGTTWDGVYTSSATKS